MLKWLFLVLGLLSFQSYSYDLYLVRHFEKLSGDTDPGLTKQGQQRAHRLAEYLSSKHIKEIYSTNYHRTKQSAQPFVRQSGLVLQVYSPDKLIELADTLKTKKQNALVVGHSNTTPELIALLGGKTTKIDESEYGELFILHNSESEVVTESMMISPQ